MSVERDSPFVSTWADAVLRLIQANRWSRIDLSIRAIPNARLLQRGCWGGSQTNGPLTLCLFRSCARIYPPHNYGGSKVASPAVLEAYQLMCYIRINTGAEALLRVRNVPTRSQVGGSGRVCATRNSPKCKVSDSRLLSP